VVCSAFEVVGCGWVGGVLWCGLEGGSCQRLKVQENKWLSAKPAMPDSAWPHANRMFRSRRAPRIELTRYHTNQPEREFLEYGENREIRKKEQH